MGDPLHLIENSDQTSIRKLFASIQRKGEWFARIERIGCLLSLVVGVSSFVAFLLRYPWVGGALAGATMLSYMVATLVDPEFADDHRLQFVDAVLEKLGEGAVVLDLELRPPEAFAPESKTPAENRGLILHYKQQWLSLSHESPAGRQVEIEMQLRTQEHQAGIEVRDLHIEEEMVLRITPFPDESEVSFSHDNLKSFRSETIQSKRRFAFVAQDLMSSALAVSALGRCLDAESL